MLIEILKWEKYNPRADAKSGWSWWRFQNDFFEDEDFYDLSASHILVWIYLCCRRSRTDGYVIRINLRQVADKARTTPQAVSEAISTLVSLNKLKIHGDERDVYESVRVRTETYSTDGRTDETDETDETFTAGVNPALPEIIQTPEPPKKARARKLKADHGPATPAGEVWEAYRESYAARYGHNPVRNAKTNSQCAQLVERLGADGARRVATFYLTHGGRWYIQCVHAFGCCLKDAEGLHTQMLANYRVTASDASKAEHSQDQAQVFANVAAKIAAERRT